MVVILDLDVETAIYVSEMIRKLDLLLAYSMLVLLVSHLRMILLAPEMHLR
jgi:hypothetical protein